MKEIVNKKKYGMYKRFLVIEILLIVIFIVCFISNFFIIYEMNKQAYNSLETSVKSNVNMLQNQLGTFDTLMANMLVNDNDLSRIESCTNMIEKRKAINAIRNKLIGFGSLYGNEFNMIVYLKNDDLIIRRGYNLEDFKIWSSIEDDMKQFLQDYGKNDEIDYSVWNLIKLGDSLYVIKSFHINDKYVCIWIPAKNIIRVAEINITGISNDCVLSDINNNISYSTTLSEEEIKGLHKLNQEGGLNNGVLIQQCIKFNIGNSNIIIYNYIQNYMQYYGILSCQIILCIAGIFSMITLAIHILYTKNKIIKPVEDFSKHITELHHNNNIEMLSDYQITELGNASEIIIDLVNQVKGLKINVYENALEKQQIQLDYLRIKIQPHFYINCLDVIYNLAQLKKYETIKELSMSTSKYLRFLFKSNKNFVYLKDEIQHIINYLNIWHIRYPDQFFQLIDVEENISLVEIPPTLIFTFVENIIKHAITWGDTIDIIVKAAKKTMDMKEYVIITVEDTGEGFDAEILKQLNKELDTLEENGKIGISNAIKRLNLLYGSEAEIIFANKNPQGALVTIKIPFQVRRISDEFTHC